MSLFGNRNKVDETPIVEEKVEEVVVEKVKVFQPASVTTIADGVEMVGDFVSSDPIEISGSIKGNIVSDKNLHICKGGKLLGDARVSNLNVDGKINGSIIVEGLTSLSDTAEMKGSLQTAKFSSTPGSIFEGTFTMSLARKAAPVDATPLNTQEKLMREIAEKAEADKAE